MEIKSFVFNPFYENTYVLWDDTKKGVIVDPGCYENYEKEEIIAFIEAEEIEIVSIINTHCHIDHVLGNYTLQQHFKCLLQIPAGEMDTYRAVEVYAPQYGVRNFTLAQPDVLLTTENKIAFGHTTLTIIACEGHSPGHLVFYLEEQKQLIGGDVLFRQSIGRTDLPGGNHAQLLSNIKTRIYTLADEVEVFPGHGPSTTIGFEKLNNPFVKG